MHKSAVLIWSRRIAIWSLALVGLYFAVFLWARISGRLADYGTYGQTGKPHRYWAPNKVRSSPPAPIGSGGWGAALFHPASHMESLLPETLRSVLPADHPGFDIRFVGRFSEDEAARYVRLLLPGHQVPRGKFDGGEYDTDRDFGIVRYLITQEDFDLWFEPDFGRRDFDEKLVRYYEHYWHGFIRPCQWTNQPARLSVWWRDGMMYVREDYGRDYSPNLEATKLDL